MEVGRPKLGNTSVTAMTIPITGIPQGGETFGQFLIAYSIRR